MSWALDRAWASNVLTSSGPTITFTYGGPVAQGAMLVCFVAGQLGDTVPISVADDVNGAWTQFDQGSPLVYVATWTWAGFYRLNAAAGTPVITATYNVNSAARGIVAGSYTGLARINAFDVGKGQSQQNPGTGSDAVTTTATGTTAVVNELAIAAVRTQSTVTVTAGTAEWTQRFNAALGGNETIQVEDVNVASPATVTATWTINDVNGDTQAIVGVFREGAPRLVGRIDAWHTGAIS